MPINAQILDNPKSDRVRRIADLTRAKGRERSGRFLIEGPQSVREAVTWRPDVVQDLFAESMHAGADDVELGKNGRAPQIAAFWQVRDPGNAGTVIRAADAAGCDAVIFVDDCVDVLNPKVIRSTAGSLFHLPVLAMSTDEFFTWTGDHNMDVWAADVYGTEERKPESLPAVLADKAAVEAPKAVLFGNEARGLEPDILTRCGRIVSIPLYGKAESLNLGTSAAVMLMSLSMSGHVERM